MGLIPEYQGVPCEDTPHRCYSLGKLQLDLIRATALRYLVKSKLLCKLLLSMRSQSSDQHGWDVAGYKALLPSPLQA